jgi:hypothetical protein
MEGVMRGSLLRTMRRTSFSANRRLGCSSAQITSNATSVKSTLMDDAWRDWMARMKQEIYMGWQVAAYGVRSNSPSYGSPFLVVWSGILPIPRLGLAELSATGSILDPQAPM